MKNLFDFLFILTPPLPSPFVYIVKDVLARTCQAV